MRRRLAAKNRYNLAHHGLSCWCGGCTSSASRAARHGRRRSLRRFGRVGGRACPLGLAVQPGLLRAGRTLHPPHSARCSPQFCSIYEPYFWWHERFWKLRPTRYLQIFNGTPFKSMIWRLLGVRLGQRVFDDGCHHDGEDPGHASVTTAPSTPAASSSATRRRTASSSPTTSPSAPAAPLGVGAFVHYGVTMGDGAVLAPDSFLMKGEEVPPHAQWGGNPAGRFAADPAAPRVHLDGDDDRGAVPAVLG